MPLPLLLAAALAAGDPCASLTQAQCAAAAEVRAGARGPGRGLVTAIADGRVAAADVWAADAALRAGGTGGAEASLATVALEVVFRRASAGDCAAATALEALARAAPHPQAGVVTKRIGRLFLARPDAIRGCWPVYERLLPLVSLERSQVCPERARAIATWGRCTCTSEACRVVVKLLARLDCGPAPAVDPLAAPGCS